MATDTLQGIPHPFAGQYARSYLAANPSPDPVLLSLHLALDAGGPRLLFNSLADRIKGLADAPGIARYPLLIALSGAITDALEGREMAIAAYEAMREVDKELFRQALVNAIYRSQEAGRYEELDKMIVATIAANPEDALLHTLREEVFRGQGRIEDSFAIYDDLIKSGKATSLEYNNAAWFLLNGETPDYSYIEK